MTDQDRVSTASDQVRREWLRRRGAALVPAALLALVLVLRVTTEGTLWLVPLGIAIVLTPVYAVVFWREAWFRRTAPAGVLLDAFGRFRLADWMSTPEFGAALANVTGKGIRGWAKGWAEGRMTVDSESLTYHPGRIATEDGVGTIEVPWNKVERAEVVPQLGNLNSGLRLTLRSGTVLDAEIRGRPATIEDVLRRTALGRPG